jgi:hypothetical protein
MGSSVAAVSDWNTKLDSAHTAFDAQQAAQTSAKDATTNLNLAMQALMDATSSIIRAVGSKAKISGDGIYALASLPVPATPSPKPAPGKPFDPTVALAETGAITLGWKCNNPEGSSGTIYQVWRQTDGSTLEYLGGSGTKDFVDETIPAGTATVMYQIQGVRSTVVGEFATFNVKFGSGGSAASIEEVATKKAA